MIETAHNRDVSPNHSRCLVLAVVAGLVGAVLLSFFGVWNNGFIAYDDNTYVYLNPDVVRGLDWRTVQWAFGYVNACHWVPLTWLSHALDCQIFALNPAGHHVTSLVLHAATVVLLFLTLRLLTGSLWRSALVAASFGIHPLRVESVAWVAERKDVLSGFFFMLTLLAYVRFAQKRQPKQVHLPSSGLNPPRSFDYWMAVFFFACGLLSKPMLVTMPFVLLLLDAWPLKRIELSALSFSSLQNIVESDQFSNLKRLVFEKIPFFVLSGIISMVTYLAQEAARTQASSVAPSLPLLPRLANVLHATATYLVQQSRGILSAPTLHAVLSCRARIGFGARRVDDHGRLSMAKSSPFYDGLALVPWGAGARQRHCSGR
jgi:hypothetical protein